MKVRKSIQKRGKKPRLTPRGKVEYAACCAQCRHVATLPRLVESLSLGGYTIPLPSPFDPRWRVLTPTKAR